MSNNKINAASVACTVFMVGDHRFMDLCSRRYFGNIFRKKYFIFHVSNI